MLALSLPMFLHHAFRASCIFCFCEPPELALERVIRKCWGLTCALVNKKTLEGWQGVMGPPRTRQKPGRAQRRQGGMHLSKGLYFYIRVCMASLTICCSNSISHFTRGKVNHHRTCCGEG